MIRAQLDVPVAWLQARDVRDLLRSPGSPCLSIYVPLRPPLSRVNESNVRFRNQVKKAEQARLGRTPEPGQADDPFFAPLYELADTSQIWRDPQGAGLAVFRSPQQWWVRQVVDPVPELSVLAESFHVRPVVRQVQMLERCQVLCVSNERVALYEGDRRRLVELALHPDVPQSMADAIGEPSHVAKTRRTRYDQGETDPRDEQLRRYFRRLDQAVWEHHSERAKLPLMLAALPEYHGYFHEASHNPYLLEQGIRRDPFKELDDAERTRLAWEARRPSFEQHVADLHERFGAARAHDQASDDLATVGKLAAFGRLATLLIEQDKHVGGTLDRGTGEIAYKPMEDPAVDDVIDDIAEIVLGQEGEVLVLPAEQMPTTTGVAGIQRF
ncbi:MAG: hypothetical protein WD534_00815 [Phycisphaeraceae bacterium]